MKLADLKPKGAGKSSFDLIDSQKVFSALGLQETSIFLDMACGRGAYSLAAAERIGAQGRVYAVDLWQEGIDTLRKEMQAPGNFFIDDHTNLQIYYSYKCRLLFFLFLNIFIKRIYSKQFQCFRFRHTAQYPVGPFLNTTS